MLNYYISLSFLGVKLDCESKHGFGLHSGTNGRDTGFWDPTKTTL